MIDSSKNLEVEPPNLLFFNFLAVEPPKPQSTNSSNQKTALGGFLNIRVSQIRGLASEFF
ncbi:hypothetical protein COV42_01170 [Candidatus Campbellbacteria bacterium CG11_big_fil_rev_8_21_14_0_20_44_21]|uniref:Uncharacterized protein n=1 Tax=Candidatus Campbellbacteria bacterium CG22_combo_CG10-13_8_21_14_all_43_18 TaxID=1974530 RepID=A0A2H0DWH0_9BACT|nr:MAG: hypothetical protein COW82_01490 [Candidatus Campbellbacteria bacterium CG22_combo_CG10-13_8_21_14_all_43_18]PIR24331.1 MAG: hypothetical protein COV42_01170 [Candidatus Campbellbacteria bacterium CG11_big_fil_rev_8_21_14_0_20_44_21]